MVADDNRARIREVGGLQALIVAVESTDEQAVALAADCLTSLCQERTCVCVCVCVCVRVCVRVCICMVAWLQCTARETKFNHLEFRFVFLADAGRVGFRTLNGTESLVAALELDGRAGATRVALLKALASAARDETTRSDVGFGAGLEAVSACLDDEDPEVRRAASWALSVLSADANTAGRIFERGVVKKLQGIVADNGHDRERAQHTLSRLLRKST